MIALDYRDVEENPPVYFFDQEGEEDFRLAASCDALIAKLYIEES
ncbi:hypothetical protein OZL92_03780 [Bacillus sonorensis]|nr:MULTISPECIES: hypothetical protein [Bacillus]TWK82713.1 hypothetical protein CHCC20335_3756 [Bacillus paralicheniformis]MCZ0067601.1 hypothetical protein [Bacillus sonorensis]MCZ0071890.1 hypothetical protein [Bacillus sonorensis]MCZ0090510.1 hypothetical protein [Bacillus sonorensis]MCZ0096131.1 hypothetical protein [Bacillus sonorensis]